MAPKLCNISLMEDDKGDDYVPDRSREIRYCYLVSIYGRSQPQSWQERHFVKKHARTQRMAGTVKAPNMRFTYPNE